MVALLEVFDVYGNDVFDEFKMDVDIENDRESEKQIAEKIELPVTELFRLEGFQEPWELMCVVLLFGFSRAFSRTDKRSLSLSLSLRFLLCKVNTKLGTASG